MAGERTVSLRDDDTGRTSGDAAPALILVLDAARPLERPLCVSLADVDELSLGRGPLRRVTRAGGRRLRLDLADAASSSQHAQLIREGRSWFLADAQSKNGTLVNGKRVRRVEIGADDLIELGNSFFLLRRGAVRPDEELPALRTLSGPLAREIHGLERVARSKVPILLLGETGTGKEMLARAAHELSRRPGPFVPVNCGAIPTTLIQSELFGVRKGAFSGADSDRAGIFVAAQGGTLFLDEIAELPEPSQVTLLRVLQSGEVMALGSARAVHADVRVVAATLQDLRARVSSGRFRDDLFARLRGHVVTLPPLRRRREDMGLLCAEILARTAGPRAAAIRFRRTAARALLSYNWPHNIRQLEQALGRALALLDGDEICLEHLPAEVADPSAASAADRGTDSRAQLVELMRLHGGNVSAVARALGTSRSQVKRLLARHEVELGPAAADEE